MPLSHAHAPSTAMNMCSTPAEQVPRMAPPLIVSCRTGPQTLPPALITCPGLPHALRQLHAGPGPLADAHRPPPLALPLAPPFLPPGARPPALPPLPLLAFFFLAFTWRGQHAEEAIYYVYTQVGAAHLFYSLFMC